MQVNWKNGLTMLLGGGEILNAFFPTIPIAVCSALAMVVRSLFPTTSTK